MEKQKRVVKLFGEIVELYGPTHNTLRQFAVLAQDFLFVPARDTETGESHYISLGDALFQFEHEAVKRGKRFPTYDDDKGERKQDGQTEDSSGAGAPGR